MDNGNGNGFIKIRRGLLEHIADGRMSHQDAGIFLQLLLQVDYETGVWTGSAHRLTPTDLDRNSLQRVQRSLKRLATDEYLKVFRHDRGRGNYKVLINRYEPLFGESIGKRLNATLSTDWRAPVYEGEWDVSRTRVGGESDVSLYPEVTDIRSKNKEKSKALVQRKPLDALTPEFVSFWEIYPRKEGKPSALRAWVRHHCNVLTDAITQGVLRWKDSEQWQDPKYIPLPATWLNDHRWEAFPPGPSQRRLPHEETKEEFHERFSRIVGNLSSKVGTGVR
jgi:hypothetical protein